MSVDMATVRAQARPAMAGQARCGMRGEVRPGMVNSDCARQVGRAVPAVVNSIVAIPAAPVAA